MKASTTVAAVAALLLLLSPALPAQENFSLRKFKAWPYVGFYPELRWVTNTAIAEPATEWLATETSLGFHGGFEFCFFPRGSDVGMCPVRFGYFRQSRLNGPYYDSGPASHVLHGIEGSIGLNLTHSTVFMIVRGGIYDPKTWHPFRASNELSGFIGFGYAYQFNLGSPTGGMAIQLPVAFGIVPSEGFGGTVGVVCKLVY